MQINTFFQAYGGRPLRRLLGTLLAVARGRPGRDEGLPGGPGDPPGARQEAADGGEGVGSASAPAQGAPPRERAPCGRGGQGTGGQDQERGEGEFPEVFL